MSRRRILVDIGSTSLANAIMTFWLEEGLKFFISHDSSDKNAVSGYWKSSKVKKVTH